MRSVLRATAILGSSSFVSILVGLVSAKAWAIFLGPSGVGYMALLQSLMTLSIMLAGLGIGTGLVRSGAHALAHSDFAGFSILYKSAALLSLLLSALGALLLILFRIPLSKWWLGGQEHAGYLVFLAFALPFSLFAALQTSALNAHHRVGALASVAVTNSLLGGVVSILLVWRWRADGVALAVLAASVISWAVSRWFYWRAFKGQMVTRPEPLTRGQFAALARSILHFAAPYTASMLVGSGVQMALPALALHTLGLESAGFYRVAVDLSGAYLSVLHNAMAQDYYPRASAAKDKPDVLIALINQQYKLVILLAAPAILATLSLAPYIITIVYSQRFIQSAGVLKWQVIGDLFRFTSMSMSYVILARHGGATYFFTEAIFGTTILAASWWGMHLFGLAGLGVGFLLAYIVYYLIVWTLLRGDIRFNVTASNKLILLCVFLTALIIQALPLAGLQNLEMPLSLATALLASVFGVRIIWAEYRMAGHRRS
jgi:antigen flippase